MRLIVQAWLVDDVRSTAPVELFSVDRAVTADPVGLTLAEGKAFTAGVRQYLIKAQCRSIAAAHSCCPVCDRTQRPKGWHGRQIRTVFGKVEVRSRRVRYCPCRAKPPEASYSPLNKVLSESMPRELEYLQAKWAARLPYASAVEMFSEVLPLADAVSVSGIKRRVRAVGLALEQEASRTVDPQQSGRQRAAAKGIASVAVDSAWLRHCHPPRRQGRHVDLVTGRACFANGATRLYAYVHNQVPCAAARLENFVAKSGCRAGERVTVLATATLK